MKRIQWAAIVAGLVLLVPMLQTAQAASLQFNLANAQESGTISYSGGSNPLTGAGIDIVDILGVGTTSNDGVSSICVGCILSFETGDYAGFSGDTWDFLSGGMISIVGGVDFPGSTTDISAGTTLLSGAFTSAQLHDHSLGIFHLHIEGATFDDTKHPALTDFYGLPGGNYDGGMTITFQTAGGISPGSAFSSSIINSGVVLNQPVPVPAAVWLFGSGLLGVVGVARKRKRL